MGHGDGDGDDGDGVDHVKMKANIAIAVCCTMLYNVEMNVINEWNGYIKQTTKY